MNRYLGRIFLIGSFLVLAGCGERAHSVAFEGGVIPVFTAPESVVVAQVGKKAITIGDFKKRLEFETGIFKACHSKVKDLETRAKKFRAHRVRGVLNLLVRDALIDQYLDDSCGGCGALDEAAAISNQVASLKLRDFKIEDAYAKAWFLRAAREEKAVFAFEPSAKEITEAEVDDAMLCQDEYKANAIATNRVTYALASNVLEKARSGEDFAALGRKYANFEPQESEEWATFERAEIDNPELRDWAFAAKTGDIGGPFDLEDGLSIVKVIGRTEGAKEASMAAQEVETVCLARITFLMVVEEPEPHTREYCRATRLRLKKMRAMEKLVESLFEKYEITYPSGETLDFKED